MIGSLRTRALRDSLRESLWAVPTALVVTCGAAAVALVALDDGITRSIDSHLVFGGGAAGARDVIGTVAGSMVTFTGTVFSVTVIVLQLSSSQFSPRVLRTFLRDRRSQVPLGIFVGTLVYSLVLLWTIRAAGDTGDATEFVPHIAISGAYLLVLASVVAFVVYIHHVSQSIRVVNVLHQIGCETREAIERVHPDADAPGDARGADALADDGMPIRAPRSGVVIGIDFDGLVQRARDAGGLLELAIQPGSFVVEGAALARWHGTAPAPDPLACLSLGRERTMREDPAFGVRQLVDIALKAMSPSINDPTTASQALDHVHATLRQLSRSRMPERMLRDDDGTARLLRPARTWDEYVGLALDEVIDVADRSRQLRARLRDLLEDLLAVAAIDRRAAVATRLDRLGRWEQ